MLLLLIISFSAVDCKAPKSSFPGEYFVLASAETILSSKGYLHCTDGYNKTIDVLIVCEAKGQWNYTSTSTCMPIGKYHSVNSY